jgi:hypothetical protein
MMVNNNNNKVLKMNKDNKGIAIVTSHTGACPPIMLNPSIVFDPFELIDDNNDKAIEQAFDARWNQLKEQGYTLCPPSHTSWNKTSTRLVSFEYNQAILEETLELWGACIQSDIADADQSTSDDEFFDCMPDQVDQLLDWSRAFGLEDRAKEIVQEAVDRMETPADLIEQALGMRPRK